MPETDIFKKMRNEEILRAQSSIRRITSSLMRGAEPNIVLEEIASVQNTLDIAKSSIQMMDDGNQCRLVPPTALNSTPESTAFAEAVWGMGYAEIPQEPGATGQQG